MTPSERKQERVVEYNKSPKVCSYCDSSLDYEDRHKKFCNSSCSAKQSNRNRREDNPCRECGEQCKQKRTTFCSTTCVQNSIRREKVLNGTAGHKMTKNYLLQEYGNICFNCGITEWCGKSLVMDLEHKDGNSENHSLENVSLLCPNCHSQTETYKAKNKGNGRHSRRLRYKEGKSY